MPDNLQVSLLCKGDASRAALELGKQEIQTLGVVGALTVITSESDAPSKGCGVAIINEQITAYVRLAGRLKQHKREREIKRCV